MFRTEDTSFAAYLDSVGVLLSSTERNLKGRTDFLFDLTQEEATKHRIEFNNDKKLSRYVRSLDALNRIVQDTKRNATR